jgi:hypothetical protein
MLNATVETTVTYNVSAKDIEEMILKEAGVERSKDVRIEYSISGGEDGYGGWNPMKLDSIKLTVTRKETN